MVVQTLGAIVSTTDQGSLARKQAQVTARGLISETYPFGGGGSSSNIPTAGTTNGTLVRSLLGLNNGDVITNLVCFMFTNGTSLTFVKMGLYDKTGNFLKATAESSASFNSGTGVFVSLALTSTYTATATDGYYVGFLQFGSGATGATLARSISTTGSGAALTGGVVLSGANATQTDISGNLALTAGGTTYWFGVS